MKQAILAVSFGTTHRDAELSCIEPLERRYAADHPGCTVRRAYTSGMIRGALAKRGIAVDSVDQALARLREEGFTSVYVAVSLLIGGFEYDKLRDLCAPFSADFETLVVGPPLLETEADMLAVARAALTHVGEDEALVLLGHGTEHAADGLYGKMEALCRTNLRPHLYIGTVEGADDKSTVLSKLAADGVKKAALAPLLLVAGEHAKNDMAGEEDESWLSSLRASGLEARAILKGLGDYPGVRDVYAAHLDALMRPRS